MRKKLRSAWTLLPLNSSSRPVCKYFYKLHCPYNSSPITSRLLLLHIVTSVKIDYLKNWYHRTPLYSRNLLHRNNLIDILLFRQIRSWFQVRQQWRLIVLHRPWDCRDLQGSLQQIPHHLHRGSLRSGWLGKLHGIHKSYRRESADRRYGMMMILRICTIMSEVNSNLHFSFY